MTSCENTIVSNINNEEQRKTQIDKILDSDKTAFDEWIKYASHAKRLDLPKDAARHLLINRKILETAQNPQNVDLIFESSCDDRLSALVVEHMPWPVTDLAEADKHKAEVIKLRDEYLRAGKPLNLFIPLPLPDSIDEIYFLNLNYKSLMNEKDRGLYRIDLHAFDTPKGRKRLYVWYFHLNRLFQNQGIGTAFYSGLHNHAINMGFDFITGRNHPENIKFFTQYLGRSRLREVRSELREIVRGHTMKRDLDYYTIDFLKPEDRLIFLTPSSNK